MQYEVKNTLASFQLVMDIIMAPVKWMHALVYLNNVVVFFQKSRGEFTEIQIRLAANA